VQSGNLYYGPYLLFKDASIHSIKRLKEGIKLFKGLISCENTQNPSGKIIWPMNKVMRLRDTIADSESGQKLFETEMTDLNLTFPDNKSTIWSKIDAANQLQTQLFDQIELMDFYLDNLL
jgi:hypothetical protein